MRSKLNNVVQKLYSIIKDRYRNCTPLLTKYHQKGYRVQKLYLLREIIESRNCTPTIYSHMGGYLLRSKKRENEQQNRMSRYGTSASKTDRREIHQIAHLVPYRAIGGGKL